MAIKLGSYVWIFGARGGARMKVKAVFENGHVVMERSDGEEFTLEPERFATFAQATPTRMDATKANEYLSRLLGGDEADTDTQATE